MLAKIYKILQRVMVKYKAFLLRNIYKAFIKK